MHHKDSKIDYAQQILDKAIKDENLQDETQINSISPSNNNQHLELNPNYHNTTLSTKLNKLIDEQDDKTSEDFERYQSMFLQEGDECPACKRGVLVLRQTPNALFLGCSAYPVCKLRYFSARLSAVSTLKMMNSTCPQCGNLLAVKKGRFGIFIGCSNYPQCNYIYKEQEEVKITCPICQKGELEKRKTRTGRIFYGCSAYPKCDYVVQGEPLLNTCPTCNFPVRYKKKVKQGIALICGNSLCSSRKKRKFEFLQES